MEKSKKTVKNRLNTIKHDFYKFAKEVESDHNPLHLESFPTAYYKEWIKFSDKTIEKIETLLDDVSQGTKLYLNLILVRAFCAIRFLLDLKASDPKEFVRAGFDWIKRIEDSLRPYKHKAEGVWLYVLNQVIHVQLIAMSKTCTIEFIYGLALIEDAQKHYTNFVNSSNEKPWGIDDIFCCYDENGNQIKSKLADDFWNFRETTTKMLLMECAIKAQNHMKIRKYGLNGIRTFMQEPHNYKFLHNLVRFAGSVSQSFTNEHYFKQAQHIIAVVNYTVWKFRCSLPLTIATSVNPILYDAVFLYAELGNFLVKKSLELIMHVKFSQEINEMDGYKNHDECERLMSHLPGLYQYENYFPNHLTSDNKIFKKMQGTIRHALDYMNYLARTNTAHHGICLEPWSIVTERWNEIEATATFQMTL